MTLLKKLPMWFFDAGVNHLNKNTWIFMELYHKFLCFLHLTEAVFINTVSIVEEEIIFRS